LFSLGELECPGANGNFSSHHVSGIGERRAGNHLAGFRQNVLTGWNLSSKIKVLLTVATKRKQKNPTARQAGIRIRRAKSSDAARIAELSGQLGYPAKPAETAQRLRTIKSASHHAVLVAESPQRRVVGWLHVSVSPLLEVQLRAEVNGLVVDDEERSHGTGALLLRAAEGWARSRGCKSMSVRSNVIRDRAHQFYLRHGYEHYKTQKAFRKPL
jgi:GNAT superfamily N-acetyltransferase